MKRVLPILAGILLLLTSPAGASSMDWSVAQLYFSETTAGRDQLLQAVQLHFHTLPPNAPETQRLQGILSALEQRLGVAGLACRIRIRPGEQINAYALPGHIVLVNEGVFTLPDDELQVLLAHELGHIQLQHPDCGMKRSPLARHHLHHIRLDAAAGSQEKVVAADRLIQAACAAEILRIEERDADIWAAARLHAAGFDLLAGVRLMQQLESLYGPAANHGPHLSFKARRQIYEEAASGDK